jgi:hypothetical protein
MEKGKCSFCFEDVEDMMAHQHSCRCAMISCSVSGCGSMFPRNQVVEHFEEFVTQHEKLVGNSMNIQQSKQMLTLSSAKNVDEIPAILQDWDENKSKENFPSLDCLIHSGRILRVCELINTIPQTDQETFKMLIDEGIGNFLLAVLYDCGENGIVIEYALLAMTTILMDRSRTALYEQLGSQGLCEIAVTLLEKYSDNARIVELVLVMTFQLARNINNGERFGDIGLFPHFLAAVEAHSANAAIVTAASKAFVNLGVHKANQQLLGDVGCIDLLMTLLRSYVDDVELVQWIISGTLNVSLPECSRKQLIEEGFPSFAMYLLLKHHDHETFVHHLWGLLHLIVIVNAETCAQVVQEPDFGEVVRTIITQHRTHAPILTQVLQTLSMISPVCESFQTIVMEEEKLCPLLVELLEQYQESGVELVGDILAVIAEFANKFPLCREEFISLNITNLLFQVLKQNSDHAKIVMRASMALGNILYDEKEKVFRNTDLAHELIEFIANDILYSYDNNMMVLSILFTHILAPFSTESSVTKQLVELDVCEYFLKIWGNFFNRPKLTYGICKTLFNIHLDCQTTCIHEKTRICELLNRTIAHNMDDASLKDDVSWTEISIQFVASLSSHSSHATALRRKCMIHLCGLVIRRHPQKEEMVSSALQIIKTLWNHEDGQLGLVLKDLNVWEKLLRDLYQNVNLIEQICDALSFTAASPKQIEGLRKLNITPLLIEIVHIHETVPMVIFAASQAFMFLAFDKKKEVVLEKDLMQKYIGFTMTNLFPRYQEDVTVMDTLLRIIFRYVSKDPAVKLQLIQLGAIDQIVSIWSHFLYSANMVTGIVETLANLITNDLLHIATSTLVYDLLTQSLATHMTESSIVEAVLPLIAKLSKLESHAIAWGDFILFDLFAELLRSSEEINVKDVFDTVNNIYKYNGSNSEEQVMQVITCAEMTKLLQENHLLEEMAATLTETISILSKVPDAQDEFDELDITPTLIQLFSSFVTKSSVTIDASRSLFNIIYDAQADTIRPRQVEYAKGFISTLLSAIWLYENDQNDTVVEQLGSTVLLLTSKIKEEVKEGLRDFCSNIDIICISIENSTTCSSMFVWIYAPY